MQRRAMKCNEMHCSALQCNAVHCSALQCIAMQCSRAGVGAMRATCNESCFAGALPGCRPSSETRATVVDRCRQRTRAVTEGSECLGAEPASRGPNSVANWQNGTVRVPSPWVARVCDRQPFCHVAGRSAEWSVRGGKRRLGRVQFCNDAMTSTLADGKRSGSGRANRDKLGVAAPGRVGSPLRSDAETA